MKNLLLSTSYTIGLDHYLQSPSYVENIVRDKLREQIAHHIGSQNYVKAEDKNSVTFTLKLIIATPDEFFAAVKRQSMNRSMFLESVAKGE